TSSKPTEYIEISDEDDEPMMKISKSESVEDNEKRNTMTKGTYQSESLKKGPNGNQKNELECPECKYRSTSVGALCAHLKLKH
ncbi:hypothetical protein PMAYCL1PPCAC_13949, partial [Pristionchus mayeri]